MAKHKTMEQIRKAALAYPETHEDHPPKSGPALLKKKFAEPTHYGLGKHGWVSCTFQRDADVPMKDALAWLDESFRAVAPKRVLAKLT